jgi:hypothetical protein
MNETGAEAFGTQADALARHLEAALSITRVLREQFASGIAASPGLEALHTRLGRMEEGLGSLAIDTTLVQMAGQRLLPSTENTQSDPEAAKPDASWLTLQRQARLLVDVNELATRNPGYAAVGVARRTTGLLYRMGVSSIRDALVLGSNNLMYQDGLTEKKMDWLRGAIAEHDPELPSLPDDAHPELAARLCPGVEAVPMAAAVPQLLWDSGIRSREHPVQHAAITIAEFLNKTPEELFDYTVPGTTTIRPMKATDYAYQKMLAQVRMYVAAMQGQPS